MSLISSLGSIANTFGPRSPALTRIDQPGQTIKPSGPTSIPGTEQSASFGKLIDAVESKQVESTAAARDVMLGNSDQIHQSVIAMQEASLSLSLMVEVRNKLVEGYQELMRLPV
jgi:flagellar hook-basal body complex protein FliE